MKTNLSILLGILFLLASCSPAEENNATSIANEHSSASEISSHESEMSTTTSQIPDSFEPETYEIIPVFEQLTFEQPLYLMTAPNEKDTLFVVERTGHIQMFENAPDSSQATVFLNLSDTVSAEGMEMGLLGLAFHPNFNDNGYFYVNYTTAEGTVISRFEANPDTYEVNMESETIVMEFPQPYPNHNGGHILFGPDGYLYIGVGDGGGSGDPENKAQDLTEIYGKLLRIDVDTQMEGSLYGIPEENPFAGNEEGIREEIYAYGLRNPWKFSFDEQRELLWLADVGQHALEEINLIEAGGNYGWNLMEGTEEYAPTEQKNTAELKAPIWEYAHSLGQSITGGYVYYGKENPSLVGTYIYGDFVSGRIWALWLKEGQVEQNVEIADTDLMIASFGYDSEGELIIIDLNGQLYHIQEVE